MCRLANGLEINGEWMHSRFWLIEQKLLVVSY